jgi:hypothetical protein
MNRAGLIALGKNSNDSLNDDGAYKKGIELFHLEPSKPFVVRIPRHY